MKDIFNLQIAYHLVEQQRSKLITATQSELCIYIKDTEDTQKAEQKNLINSGLGLSKAP